jgi:hypothetical protein
MVAGISGELFWIFWLKDGGGNRLLAELFLIWRLKNGDGNCW